MAALILPSRFTQQPQGAVNVDLSSPLTRGIALVYSGGQGTINLVNNQALGLVGTPEKTVCPDGLATGFVRADGDGLSAGNSSSLNTNDITLFVVAHLGATAASSGYMLLSRDDATLGRAHVLDINTFGAWGARFYVNGGGTEGTNELRENVAPTLNRRYVICATKSGGTAKLFVNGRLVASSTSFPTIATTTGDSQIGRRTYSEFTDVFTGNIPIALQFGRGLTDSEAVELSANPWQLFRAKPRVLYFDVAVALTVALNQTTETDAAQAITASPVHRLLAQAAETDSAQAIASSKTVAVAQATETDSAQAISADTTKVVAVGQATETDAATAISSRKTLAVGLVTETEFAQAIAHYKAAGVLQAVEADSAHSITRVKRKSIAQATETDSAIGVTALGGYVPPFEAHPIRISFDAGYEKLGVRAAYVDGAPGLRMSIYNQTSDLMFAPGSGLVFVPGSDLMFGATASSYPGIKLEVVT